VCSGDVKYHLGFTMDRPTINKGKSVHISLCANPSHLEAVNPIVEVLFRLIKLPLKSLFRYYLRLY
jgi:2-oxoglutarate dehydrogenase complex dehydrogenase (E1) component-like enzyme